MLYDSANKLAKRQFTEQDTQISTHHEDKLIDEMNAENFNKIMTMRISSRRLSTYSHRVRFYELPVLSIQLTHN